MLTVPLVEDATYVGFSSKPRPPLAVGKKGHSLSWYLILGGTTSKKKRKKGGTTGCLERQVSKYISPNVGQNMADPTTKQLALWQGFPLQKLRSPD